MSAALAIAEEVNNLALTVAAPAGPAGALDNSCASACFFIWAAGKQRLGGSVAIHRPYIDRELYKSLPLDEAKRRYAELERTARRMLADHGIAETVIHTLFSTDSRSAVFLSDRTLFQLRNKAFYDEMLIARCGESHREAEARSKQAIEKNNGASLGSIRERVAQGLEAKLSFMRCEFDTSLAIAREASGRVKRALPAMDR